MLGTGEWHVDSLYLNNFRCFDELLIDFDKELTVLVGTNGSGKTSVLDGLAIMLSTVLRNFDGPTRGFQLSDAREIPEDLDSKAAVAQMSQQFPVSAQIDAALNHDKYWWRRTRSSANGRTSWGEKNTPVGADMTALWNHANSGNSRDTVLPVIALYGVERLIGVIKASKEISKGRSGAFDTALNGRSDYRRLEQYIAALTLADFQAARRGADAEAARAQLDAIRLASNSVLEGSGWKDPEWNPVIKELTLTHPDRGTLPLSFMSSGIRIAAGLVLDIVSRMARANPHLGSKSLLVDTPGIVMIDEVDLHLHPMWQQQIVPKLRQTLPRVQFIVTTHSPQVLSTVDASHIRILDGSTVRKAEFSEGLRSDIILSSIMGTDPEPEMGINVALQRYMELVDNGEGASLPAVELRRRLDSELGGIAYVPKLAEADAMMAFDGLVD